MSNPPLAVAQWHYPRHLDPMVRTSLQDTPAVLINGPRQCGKTTLVRQYAGSMAYFVGPE